LHISIYLAPFCAYYIKFQFAFQDRIPLRPRLSSWGASAMKNSDWRSVTKVVLVSLNSYLILSLNFLGVFAQGPPNQRLQQRHDQVGHS